MVGKLSAEEERRFLCPEKELTAKQLAQASVVTGKLLGIMPEASYEDHCNTVRRAFPNSTGTARNASINRCIFG